MRNASLGLLLLGLLASAAGAQQAQDPEAVARGRTLFTGKGNCFVCHGTKATGTPLGPSLADTTWLNVDGSQAAITKLIREGVPKPKQYPGLMPPMGGAKLSDREVADLASYIFTLGLQAGKQPRS